MIRGRSLALRLALLLAAAVIVVLLAAGFVVNRAASQSLADTIGPRDEARLDLAVAAVEEALERGVGGPPLQRLLREIAGRSGATVRVLDASGNPIAEAGRLPPRVTETEELRRDLSAAAGGGVFELVVADPQAGFVRTFNAALVITGVVAVVALLVVAALVASRVTRPLREVAAAARQLGHGDLAARARGGDDAESRELAAAFNEMADRLQRSEQLRRRAASDLAHDLATPATVLETQLQAMVDGVVPADASQLESARSAAASLSGIIAQLGVLTQAEAAPLQRDAVRVDAVEVAREVLDALDGLLRQHDAHGELGADEPAPVLVDPGQLSRALRNLVTNAIEHSPPGGRVVVAVERAAGVEIRVSDDGPGIAADDVPYVFERFYRADRSRGVRSGSGIGLTVARELIGANGGSVEVESTGPSGTTFLVRLPPAPA